MDKQIPLFKVFVKSNAASQAVRDVLESEFIGQGKEVDRLEKQLSNYLTNPFVNTVNSATSGLHLALHMAKDGSHRNEILTTPLTCVATNTPIVANGLKIKWVDVNRKDCNIDVADLRRKISDRTLAILAVHWGGYPVDLDAIDQVARDCERLYEFRPAIIEDCAHAFGAKYKRAMIGSRNTCVFSFQAIKHLTTGDGGLITSPCEEHYNRAKLLRWYGLDRTTSNDFRCEQNITEAGFKFHMNDIAAVIGLNNMPFALDNIVQHQNNSAVYDKELKGVPGVELLQLDKDRESACWVYTLLVDRRDDFIKKMKSCGIHASRVHDRNDKHTCFEEFRCLLPELDYVCSKMVCLPCGWWLSPDNLGHIIESVKHGW